MAEKKTRTTKKTEKAPSHVAPKAPRTPRKKKGNPVAIVVSLCVVAALFFGAALFAIHVDGLDTIYPGVTFAGVDVGGMTISEAGDALEAAGYGAEDSAVTVSLPLEHSLSISVKDAVKSMEPIEAAAALYEYGREGNLAQSLIAYLRCSVNGHEVDEGSVQTVDSDFVKSAVTQKVQEINAQLMGESLVIGEKEITAVKGAKSVILDETAIYTMVMNALQSGEYGELSYIPQSTGDDDIDIDSIYDTVFKEPKNSEYDPDTHSAGEHIVGVDFDLQAAKKAWENAAAGQRVTIPLVHTEPEITQQALNDKLFADILAEKTTSLVGSSKARINNVELACKAINNIVLNPGDEFSYNTALGKRTTQAGYQAAGAYSGGEVVSEIGGGICQVSSTLYYCALYSNLEITDRTCHYFAVAYLPAGLDATVSWGGPEFKFANNREYPIRIEAFVEGNSMTVKILGTDVDGSYVTIYTEAWINSDESTGVQSYRNVYDKDGNLLSSEKEAVSKYHVHKEEEETPTPSPDISPEITPEVSPDVTPEVSPEVTPEISPEVTVSPEITPEVSPIPTPEPTKRPASGSDLT